jgi:large subunit ribosomal protein L19
MDSIRRQGLKDDIPEFSVGDTLKIHVRVREGQKTRIQIFQGVVIAQRGSGIEESFTARKISGGIAVERVFPLHGPNVEKIEVMKRGRVRRAKLNYLKERIGKSARIAERRTSKTEAQDKKA